MAVRWLFGAAFATALGLILALGGCGGETGEGPGGTASVDAAPLDLGGLYEVKGTTQVLASGDEREISGKLILVQEGEAYTSTFSLSTMFPTPDGLRKTDVIGKGSGTIQGRRLSGSAETQLVMASVRGVDPKFAYLPRVIGARIGSTTVGVVSDDGQITVEIESQQAGDQPYLATRTTLVGFRVDPRSLRPDGAPAPEAR